MYRNGSVTWKIKMLTSLWPQLPSYSAFCTGWRVRGSLGYLLLPHARQSPVSGSCLLTAGPSLLPVSFSACRSPRCSSPALPHAPSFLLAPLSHFLPSPLSTLWWGIKAYPPLMISHGVVVWKAPWVFLTPFRKSRTLNSPKVSIWLRWDEYYWFCISILKH